jgi:hypothetical protein
MVLELGTYADMPPQCEGCRPHLMSTFWEFAMSVAPLNCRGNREVSNAQWSIISRLKQQHGNEAFLIWRVYGVGD